MLVQALEMNGQISVHAFTDEYSISSWARKAIQIASHNGIVQGYEDSNLMPRNFTSRAEAVTAIVRALEILK